MGRGHGIGFDRVRRGQQTGKGFSHALERAIENIRIPAHELAADIDKLIIAVLQDRKTWAGHGHCSKWSVIASGMNGSPEEGELP